MRLPGRIEIVPGPTGWGVWVNDTRAGYVEYICDACGRTEKEPLVSIYQINTMCTCGLNQQPSFVTQMRRSRSWKHPAWVEFDEVWYWADKGVPTISEDAA